MAYEELEKKHVEAVVGADKLLTQAIRCLEWYNKLEPVLIVREVERYLSTYVETVMDKNEW